MLFILRPLVHPKRSYLTIPCETNGSDFSSILLPFVTSWIIMLMSTQGLDFFSPVMKPWATPHNLSNSTWIRSRMAVLKTILYKVGVQVTNNPKICLFLVYFFQLHSCSAAEKSCQEICKFLGCLKFLHQSYKKWSLVYTLTRQVSFAKPRKM